LAAGKGSRMKSNLPKVLQPLAAKPLLAHVIETADLLENNQSHVVIGHEAELVREHFKERSDLIWAEQKEQLGTGHAVAQAVANLNDEGITLVLYGDVPLVKAATLTHLLSLVSDEAMALLTVDLANPKGYGRIVRNDENHVIAIVEEKDASDEQKKITEVNTGILALQTSLLKQLLPKISDENAQGEYYLTDVIALAVSEGKSIETVCTHDEIEVQGVNDKKQLAILERAYQAQLVDELLLQGVTVADPARLDIRGKVTVGQDVAIDINCLLQGEVHLGNNVSIGANCIIGEPSKKVSIADNTEIKANCIIEAGIIGEGCVIGPFARIRPGTELKAKAKIGNFVETKKSVIGEGSKVNHLTYIGDAEIGKDVNIGAGTITCNYDGVNKHKTILEDGVFIGSNSSLVAPITVGKNATVGAGSTINMNVPAEQLTVARGKQRNIAGWKKPEKKK
jgi:bifunctional UDP-N-acetylglucosamine pyrophosphorylase/glucosamine-1-phosphate N-acetyltransferase